MKFSLHSNILDSNFLVLLSKPSLFSHKQGLLSAAPEIVNQPLGHDNLHSHSHGGHHHGIDMDHPILALNMAIISICIKEGY